MPNPSDEHTIDDRDRIERAFRRLTTEQRTALVLHHHLGLPLAESASILQIPDGDDEVTAEPRDGGTARGPGRRRTGGRGTDGMDRMSSRDLDRRLEGWFASAGADDVPQGLLDDVFSVTRTSRQRRGAMGRLVTAATDWWRAP